MDSTSTGVRATDLSVFVFVLAAMLSGTWLADQFGPGWTPTYLAVTAAVAVGWTVYHRYRIAPHFRPDDDADGDDPRPDAAGRAGGSPPSDASDADPRRGRETESGSSE
ncbi:hypothetical protein [Candidatus Halobonum tyrrellensis]|uniref:DUF8074 domain-containing protein n=1 Tax=Candidatus Halobonum tyrrellensis G22 TaxID=1324957 RepID=V4HA97_9EURY|nr:hypothetical protein [Candidatus Halobonum tyrrellensis]ESP86973.1 hypothetical protein K933_15677 [Candidatus Halobonum tyrrellensis G22]